MKTKETKIDMPVIHVFVGTSKSKMTPGKAVFVLTMEDSHGHFFKLKPETVMSGDSYITHHFILLMALSKTIKVLSDGIKGPFRIIFHSDDERIAFEWNTEYKEDGHFSDQTDDREMWQRIANSVMGKNIELVISGPNSVLNGISKIENRRARVI